ncbi:putative transporter [Colletotrichum trifolii]|uniref:Putative transporter n=1 Tax=Colletotrichum trifolii TaxID=5466 RepID=A0A4R8RFA8_COLTR|nr:putative transporter [Colletotrichum trifolii]
MEQVGELALDMKFWLVFAIAFLCMIANGPISTFVPIIINGFGFSTLNSLLLTMPAGAYGGTVQLVMPYLAYKFKNCRTWIVFGAQLGTTLAALLLWLLPRSAKAGLLFAAYILPSVGGGYAVLMGLQIANTAGYTKRSIASSGLYIGYCLGNFVGPLVFRKEDAPEYAAGFVIVVITSLAAGVLGLVYRFVCVWHNKKRDNAGVMEGFDHAYEDDLTDMKARTIFYEDEESDGLTALMAVSLFYWWAPRSPSTVHRHSSWWWTSVLIRHAQQMNLHREPTSAQVLSGTLNLSLRRRIWWTAFARERLTALCQSKPAIIDPDDCNIQELSLSDFPSDPRYRRKGEIFIQWVRLCMVIGRIAKTLSRSAMPTTSCLPPDHHRQELVNWVNSLPLHLQLPIGSARTQNFDRDVHQLYLPYLTTIIVLHLKRSANTLPEALPPAILAASCIARIMRDILSRGNTRFLMAISCWYCGTAFIPLLQACRIPHLAKDANDCLDILERAVEELQLMWGSANVIREGFKRLRTASNEATRPARSQTSSIPDETSTRLMEPSPTHTECQGMKDFGWMALFPFVTQQTGGIAESLLMGKQNGTASRGFLSPDNFLFHDNIATQFEDLFEPFVDYRLDFMVPG